jgi:hypothetical protein
VEVHVLKPNDTWNESAVSEDSVTGKLTRRLTCDGLYNETPTYHLNAAFSADGRHLIFATAREGGSALMRADVETGALTVIAVADGVGSYGQLHNAGSNGPFAEGTSGGGFTGNATAIIQATRQAVAAVGRSLRLYNLKTLEERVLIEDCGAEFRYGSPIGALDGSFVVVPRVPAHPDIIAGRYPRRPYRRALVEEFGGMPTTYLKIDLASGAVREVFHEDVCGSHHVQPCPADQDLWLIDRDMPPDFWAGGDGRRSTRAWLLNTRSGKLTRLKQNDEWGFQIHTNWSPDGSLVYYHGPAARGGQYIGAIDTKARVVWERVFAAPHYGHVSTHTRAPAIITDGLLTPDLVTAIYFRDLDTSGAPRIEVLARHATEWGTLQGQYTHPHPHVSPDGRWLCYNKGEKGRTDVYLVRLS